MKASEEKGDKAKAKYLEIAKVRASIAFTLACMRKRACMRVVLRESVQRAASAVQAFTGATEPRKAVSAFEEYTVSR